MLRMKAEPKRRGGGRAIVSDQAEPCLVLRPCARFAAMHQVRRPHEDVALFRKEVALFATDALALLDEIASRCLGVVDLRIEAPGAIRVNTGKNSVAALVVGQLTPA